MLFARLPLPSKYSQTIWNRSLHGNQKLRVQLLVKVLPPMPPSVLAGLPLWTFLPSRDASMALKSP